MRWRIRNQILAPLLTLLVGVAGVSTWTAAASAGRAWRQLEEQFRSIARTLGEATFPLNHAVLRQMKGLSGAEYLLIRAGGERTSTFATVPTMTPPTEAVVEDWQALRLGPRVEVDGHAYLCSGLRLGRHPDNAGATLFILYPEARWRAVLWEAIGPSLTLGSFVGFASVALAVFLGRGLSRRLQDLRRRTQAIAHGDFTPMPLPGRDDELLDLGRSVNDMARQLTRLQEAVRKAERLRLLGQVGAGLAHQLRNGVTGARLAVQLHARDCHGPADVEALEVALRQLTLLEAHLKQFLDLGHDGPARRQRCPLGEVVSEAVALLRPRCRHARIDLRWRPPDEDIAVDADRGQLGQLILNVLGNGVEAAGPGGWVEAVLRIEDGGSRMEDRPSSPILDPPSSILGVIEVTDSGPGPPPELAERLFEPFATGKPEGVGLGLALARQVAEAHGGRIDWRRQAGQTCFRIELPLAEKGCG